MDRGKNHEKRTPISIDISDGDIYEAMKEIPGYIDVTPEDLKDIYSHAYRHALQRIMGSICARDIMTTAVCSVRRETPIREVVEIMAEREISGVPVVDEDRKLVGIISEKDFCSNMGDRRARSLMGIIAECVNNRSCLAMTIRDQKAEDIMTFPVISIPEDAVLKTITDTLTENGINRVPVVDANGCLTGIVSRADIVRISFEKPC
jgi:CBS domain-containing membrane protein